MAKFGLTQLVIATLNILLVVLFVVANKDFCGSVFETQVGRILVGHVVDSAVVVDEFECHLKCLGNNSCKSFNVLQKGDNNAKIRLCELNNETRETKPGDLKEKKGSAYYGPVQISCIDVNSAKRHPGDKEKQSGTLCVPVGVADTNIIPDARMNATSYAWSNYQPYFGRLHEQRGNGAWGPGSSSNRKDYLQVDMGTVQYVCAVATQGTRTHDEWTTSYKVHFSTDGVNWKAYNERKSEHVFPGNTDRHTVVNHSLSTNVKARFVRFYPVTYHSCPCLRVEIFVSK